MTYQGEQFYKAQRSTDQQQENTEETENQRMTQTEQ